jgi:hypothetical protein
VFLPLFVQRTPIILGESQDGVGDSKKKKEKEKHEYLAYKYSKRKKGNLHDAQLGYPGCNLVFGYNSCIGKSIVLFKFTLNASKSVAVGSIPLVTFCLQEQVLSYPQLT